MQIINKRKYSYAVSIFLVGTSLIAFSLWGLKFGIDFTGGTEMKVKFANDIPASGVISEKLKEFNLNSFTYQPASDNTAFLRYTNSDEEINEKVLAKLKELDAGVSQLSVDFIGSSVSDQLKRSAVVSLILAIVGIMLYIAWAFRKVSYPISSWKYGFGAIIALFHDVMITIGVFSALGKFYGIEVGVPFIAALLTILGFSVNDTIVVYDRTRENLQRSSSKEDFESIANRSINETLARSINTTLSVIIVLVALIILGGEAIRYFSLALFIGIGFGSFSSIFVATALLVTMYKFQISKK